MTERQLRAPGETIEAVMDTRVLREFLEMLGPDGPDLLRSIADTYAIETPPVLTALGLALKRGDHQAASRLAHRLKGSCLTIGASRLAANCAAVEATCSIGTLPCAETYATLRTNFADTTRALRLFLSDL
jgi:HPt (histidine-containing phosphotransfer) domain-containing protein